MKMLFSVLVVILLVSCGQSQNTTGHTILSAIVGGKTVTAEERPWVTSITFGGNQWCSGSIIGDRWIVTAAHCFYGINYFVTDLKVLAGGDGTRGSLEQLPSIKSIYIHPQFKGQSTTPRDFALIQLMAPIKFSKTIKQIQLRDVTNAKLDSYEVTVDGWGFKSKTQEVTNELRSFTLPFVRSSEVSETTPSGQLIHPYMREPGIFMVLNDAASTCGGDSGAGWTIKLRSGPHLIGVHSAGNCEGFSVAADISAVLPWIRTIVTANP